MTVHQFIGRIRDVFSSDKRRRLWIVIGMIGLALLILPKMFRKTDTVPATAKTAEEYITQTEQRLKTLVESIEGAGQCQVMVTLENGVEYVYATEERRNTDREENVSGDDSRLTQRDDNQSSAILVESDSGREGLLVTEVQPTVRGVVVVCEGGDDAAVRQRVMDAVTVALNISQKRVCITKLS